LIKRWAWKTTGSSGRGNIGGVFCLGAREARGKKTYLTGPDMVQTRKPKEGRAPRNMDQENHFSREKLANPENSHTERTI